jgi:hypothetical protein
MSTESKIEELDWDALAGVSGGDNYGQGQGFHGFFRGDPGYVSDDDQAENVALQGDLRNAGFSWVQGHIGNSPGVDTPAFTATCGRPNCGWNDNNRVGFQGRF